MTPTPPFSFLDQKIAEICGLSLGLNSQTLNMALSALSLATRKGHLCISLESFHLDGYLDEEESELVKETKLLEQEIREGFEFLKLHLLEEDLSHPVVRSKDLLYLQSSFRKETALLENLKSLIGKPDHIYTLTQKSKDTLSIEQQQAVQRSLNSTLALIAGGPGTGKTHTVGVLIHEILSQSVKPLSIAMTAPTGKAALQLQASLLRACPDLATQKACTLHALLKLKHQTPIIDAERDLPYDLIVVDECSMVEPWILVHLFARLKKGAHLILVGDPDQLPAIEQGNCFHDLIQMAAQSPDQIALSHLKQMRRIESKSLKELTEHVRLSNEDKPFQLLNHPSEELIWSSSEKGFSYEKYASFFPLGTHSEADIPKLSEELARFRILSSLNHGRLGVKTINLVAWESWRQKAHVKWGVLPIMIVQNHSKTDLFNGECGTLVVPMDNWQSSRSIESLKWTQGAYALFPGKKPLPAFLLPAFELCFCLSVHKSQGSEFSHVVLLLPEGSHRFGKELLYTGITRSKHKLEIWGTKEEIRKSLLRPTERRSGLVARFS